MRNKQSCAKIFVIGFNKTGTRTIHNFFVGNNIKSIHWDQGKLARTIKFNVDNMDPYSTPTPLLGNYDTYTVFSDMEDIEQNIYANELYFTHLDKHYTGSKFILNVRDIDTWIQSRLKHHNKKLGNYATFFCNKYGFSLSELQAKWRNDYEKHVQNVTTYFYDRPHKLCVFDIEKDSVQKLIDFLPDYTLQAKYFLHYGKTLV